jgi:hypothetical protein
MSQRRGKRKKGAVMSMSEKDFVALADEIKRGEASGIVFTEEHLTILSDFCQGQNPAFMRGRWHSYIKGECGKNGGEIKKLTPAQAERAAGRTWAK